MHQKLHTWMAAFYFFHLLFIYFFMYITVTVIENHIFLRDLFRHIAAQVFIRNKKDILIGKFPYYLNRV